MLHDLLLAVLIVLVSLLYVKFAKLTKAIDGLYEDFEYSLGCIDKELKEIISDIANSTAKLQDRICGVHDKLDKFNKGLESFNTNIINELNNVKLNTRDIVSTAVKDSNSHRQVLYHELIALRDKLDAHNNYVIAHNKETRQVSSELLSAIQASSLEKTDNVSADTETAIEKPKKAIRRNRRKYTKDTEEVKE